MKLVVRLAGLALVLAGTLAHAAARSSAPASPPAPTAGSEGVHPALRNAPGYVPLFDPESASVKIGRRLNAPLVGMRFSDGAKSLDDLGRQICWAVHHSSPDSLRRLCITGPEFSEILWREFPQSRPVTGLRADDAWIYLDARLRGGISRLLDEWAGQNVTYLRWDRGDTTAIYRNFRLHNGLRLVVRDEQGKERTVDAIRAVAERKGVFKIQSMKD